MLCAVFVLQFTVHIVNGRPEEGDAALVKPKT